MTTSMIQYLNELQQHNSKTWFHEHKREYEIAFGEFLNLIEKLQWEIGTFEPAVMNFETKSLTFKLQRDTRFSNDKSPYNPSFRAHIGSKGKLPVPVGYYVMITPNGSFLGGGLFASCFSDATNRIRKAIDEHSTSFLNIVKDCDFEICGEQLKKVPKLYADDHPAQAYLKYKSWYLEYPLDDAVFADLEAFLSNATTIFKKMKPFNDFLNDALQDFVFPQR